MVKKAARKRSSIHLANPSHKRIQVKLSRKTLISLRIGIIFLLFLILIFIIKSAFISVKNAVWDGENQLVIAYEFNNELGLVKFDPVLREALIVSFPSDMLLPLALGFQDYRVDKIKALALQEHIKLGQLLKDSITQSIGILTDGYITGAKGKDLKLNKLILYSLFNRSNSNLTAWDKIRLLVYVSNLKISEIKYYQAANEFLKTKIIPDGSQILVIDDNVLTTFVLQELANPVFLQEKLTWELYNATDQDGLANNMRRITANSGFDVIGIRQALEFKKTSTLYVSDAKKINANVRRFAEFFHFPIVVDNSITQRSDVALYLGDDYFIKYYTNSELY